MIIRRLFSFSPILALLTAANAQTLNPKPIKALGVPRLLSTQANPLTLDTVNPNYVDSRGLYNPTAIALDLSSNPPSVYIADTSNNRVLGWKYASQLNNGAPADVVLGQNDFFSTLPQGPGGLTTGLNSPTGLAVDKSGNVYVADTGNNRILRFPQPFLQQGTAKTPDLILGQSGFGSSGANPVGITANSLFLNLGQGFPAHIGLAFDPSGNLFVADAGNNRVLRYPSAALSAGTNGPAADLVLGQTIFTTNRNAMGQRGNKTGITNPLGLAFDSAGRLFVADSNFRVLVYAPGFANGTAAARILGVAVQVQDQPAPAPVSEVNVGFVTSVAIGPNNRPVVVDSGNNRVLIYPSFDQWPPESPTAISPSALAVIGQNTFAARMGNQGNLSPAASTLQTPFDAAASATELFVVDTGNNRVLAYPFPGLGFGVIASRVLGQVDFTLSGADLVEGRGFSFSASGASASIVIDRNSTPPHLYVADTANNRVLGFVDFNNAKLGDSADLVIGQQNLFSSAFNNLTNNPTLPTPTGLNHPSALALDAAGNLFVADSGNSRVLRFPTPYGQPNRISLTSDLVIGQANFTTSVTSASNKTLQNPSGVAVLPDGSLLVSDENLNRVLYFPQPLSSGMSATKVLGQSDFITPNATSSGAPAVFDPARFSSPRQIAVDAQSHIYVTDPGNRRVAVFDAIANLSPFLPAPLFALTSNLNQPVGIAVGAEGTPNAGQLWIADYGANALFHFPSFAQLTQSTPPDLGVGAFHPLSAAFDTYGDLAIADAANRVLLYVPQVVILNGSSFASGPVAPGTIISIFPAGTPATSTTAVLAPRTANFADFASPLPLPTSLSDIQVLVNGVPAPLFYVSPTQINLPLPSTLPTSGTVDLQIVSNNSPRVYGLSEVSLSSVSPGLFTLAGSGSGQLAAINAADGSVNTASSPLVRGRFLTLFGTGQGSVPNGPPDGTAASGQTSTADRPRIVIGGIDVQDADIQYSGLAPGLIGVWQINVRVPQEVTAGNQVPVVVYLRSVPSQPGTFIALR